MAHNRVEFFAYRSNIDLHATTSVYLDKNPFGVTLPSGASIGAEITFVSSGGTVAYVGIERWLMAWRLSSTDTVSSNASDLRQVKLGGDSGAGSLLDNAAAVGGADFGFTFTPDGGGRDWAIRGVLWADDKVSV